MPYARSRASAGIPCNDTRDTDRYELMLIKAGHHLLARQRQKTVTVSESEAIDAALGTIWEAKKLYRAELKIKLREQGIVFAEIMRKRKVAQ